MIVDIEGGMRQSGSRVAALVVLVAFTLGGVGGYVMGTIAPIQLPSSTGRLVHLFVPSKPTTSSGADADRGDSPAASYGSALEETNRRIATCDTVLNDQPEYCSGTGPWASPHPTGVTPESDDPGVERIQ